MELDRGHNSMSSHGRACLIMVVHVYSWWSMSSQGGAILLFHGKVRHFMAGYVLSWQRMSSHGSAAHVF